LWQTRPVDSVYPIVYIDAIVVKIREGGAVDNRAAHLVVGVDVEGFKHVLGIWIAEHEGAKFWQNVLNELVNRGLRDVLIICCDGLSGLPDAIANVWPKAIVQTCVVHLIRASMKFVPLVDRKEVARSLRSIYTAVNQDAAEHAFNELKHQWGDKYSGLISTWQNSWEQFIPFLEFHPAIRKVIYTTNMIESMNYQLRKITKTRGHFPSTESAIKLLYLGIRNITGRHIDGEGRFAGKRGTGTYGWNSALNAFAARFGDRLPL
jgi:putative transposase